MAEDTAFLDGVQQLDAALVEGDGVNKEDICKQFQAVKRILEPLLGFIEKIPIYGKTIAGAIRLLIRIGDIACPVG